MRRWLRAAFLFWIAWAGTVGADDARHVHVRIETDPPRLQVFQLEEEHWHRKGTSNDTPIRLFRGNGGEVFLRFYWDAGPLRQLLNPVLGPASPPLQETYSSEDFEKYREQGWILYTHLDSAALHHEITLQPADRFLLRWGGWLLAAGLALPLLILRVRRRAPVVPAPLAIISEPTVLMMDPARLPWQVANQSAIDGYTVESRLGEGAFAIVYKVRKTGTQETPLALKLLKGTDALGKEALPRFQREMQALRRLRHANIPYLADMGDFRGLPYLVMEFVPGETLRERLNQGKLPYLEAVEHMRDLAAALSFAHRHGILHRDVKPENVIVRPHGGTCLTDFGLARADDSADLTVEGTIMGTPAYLPPEILQGQSPTALSDQYSFACVSYELLTGQPPFPGDKPLEVMMAHLNQPIPELRAQGTYPQWMRDLLQRMMQKDPAKRYPDMDVVEKLIQRMLTSRGRA